MRPMMLLVAGFAALYPTIVVGAGWTYSEKSDPINDRITHTAILEEKSQEVVLFERCWETEKNVWNHEVGILVPRVDFAKTEDPRPLRYRADKGEVRTVTGYVFPGAIAFDVKPTEALSKVFAEAALIAFEIDTDRGRRFVAEIPISPSGRRDHARWQAECQKRISK